MCGRFSLAGSVDVYADYFSVERVALESLTPSWNIAPTDRVAVVAEHDQVRALGTMRWGLVPHWQPVETAKDPTSLRLERGQINARAETVANRPAFRDSFRRKRCLIPADGFYEWELRNGRKVPHWIFRADGYPLGFAGIWASWRHPDSGEWLRSCAIVTTVAVGPIAPLHDRMPVALVPEVWDAWLDRDQLDPDAAAGLLQPIQDDLWMTVEVGQAVNSVKNNGPECRQPVVH